MASQTVDTDNKEGMIFHFRGSIKSLPGKLMAKLVEFAKKTKRLGREDPRRIIHSFKVGLAIALVSLFYYFEPLYKGFGISAMWAVLTVVVVFEFSVGGTLSRGLNRGLATFLASALGFGAHHLASLPGEKGEPILLGLFVFLLAAAVSFLRFFPEMKARYDYGLMIFILTFSLISVSAYHDDEVMRIAYERVITILIGIFTALFVCIFICPVWAGDDLHSLVANNIDKLANFFEAFVPLYLKISQEGEPEMTFLEGYKCVLNSKQTEESLANFAGWEPGHGKFRFRHPWKKYLKIGSQTRDCAYRIESLNGYLILNTETQIPEEIRGKMQDACINMSSEAVKALKELAFSIKTMTKPCSADSHITKSKIAAKNLKSLLSASLCKETEISEVMQAITVVSLLVDVVACTEKIAESVQELASFAKFKSEKPKQAPLRTSSKISEPEHVITIHQPSSLPE
ncbi:hypothetical protein WN944_027462 [Citrus x changshan-huyou]|uniref:Aluminum-activated malate transporter 2 n=3 Tax=Citrus TaxID=2706 RepID=A0ACB8IR71_CITSI|nr:Aluminum-activated malate transporter 2 [Citrus sinensis]